MEQTTYAKVQQAKSPQEALLHLAQALDDLRAELALARQQPADDGWGNWEQPVEEEQPAPKAEIEYDEGTTTVKLPTVPKEKQAAREVFARDTLQLGENIPELGTSAPGVYAIGGPLWLYHGNRELFMSYPYEMRAAMVQDILDDDPEMAEEVGRDALKDEGGGMSRGDAEERFYGKRID